MGIAVVVEAGSYHFGMVSRHQQQQQQMAHAQSDKLLPVGATNNANMDSSSFSNNPQQPQPLFPAPVNVFKLDTHYPLPLGHAAANQLPAMSAAAMKRSTALKIPMLNPAECFVFRSNGASLNSPSGMRLPSVRLENRLVADAPPSPSFNAFIQPRTSIFSNRNSSNSISGMVNSNANVPPSTSRNAKGAGGGEWGMKTTVGEGEDNQQYNNNNNTENGINAMPRAVVFATD
uniref:Uncharacterized protein n=1 Tax=Polytomella parva TaxID=51329 RepID=A0A7S0VD32_9CHLO